MSGRHKNRPFGYIEKHKIQIEDFVREKVTPKRLGIVISIELIEMGGTQFYEAGVIFDGILERHPLFLFEKA